jgi:glycosyltransferase involved in cell wall biosynthesis
MAVGRRDVDDPAVLQIPSEAENGPWAKMVGALAEGLEPLAGKVRGAGRAQQLIRLAQNRRRFTDWYRGREHFDYPGTAAIIGLPATPPDIIHCHNLHDRYFDLRQLAKISHAVPTVVTLHDEWTFTGHCAYTMGCERWLISCGHCPDLGIYPPVRRDATAENWALKQSIYAKSRLYISTPSRWLMERARRSMLFAGAAGDRVIYNGVDLTLFKPADQTAARRLLGLPDTPLMVLFTANAARRNMFKDYETVRAAALGAAQQLGERPLLLVALGDKGASEFFGTAETRFVPYERDPARVAAYYQSADVYLHAANADNLPTTILEALACGIPVVATAVGGIPEQVKSLADAPGGWSGATSALDLATGVLVPPRDANGMAAGTAFILGDQDLRRRLSANARADAEQRFDLARQLDNTIDWYHTILESWRTPPAPH